jgi:putative ABC transport system permease protein
VWRATIKGLLAKKLRLALTALSVVLGVGFVAGTYVLTDTMNAAFDDLFSQAGTGSDVTVRSVSAFQTGAAGPGAGGGAEDRDPLEEELLEAIRGVEGVAVAVGDVQGYAQIVNPATGEAIGGFGPPTIGMNWTETSDAIIDIREGAPPAGPDEVVIDAANASANEIALGDRVRVLFQGPPREFRVVGIAGFGDADNLAGATLALFDTDTAQTVLDREGEFDSISVVADEGVTATALRGNVQAVLPDGAEAVTTASVADEQAAALKEGLGFFQTALLVFAGVALFVGSFIIFNTFSIIVAQRTRELALLRALGASRRQVLTSVIGEAAVVGVFASLVGIGAGILIAMGLRAMLELFGISLPATDLQLLPRTIVVALVVGIVVTLTASIFPARRAAAVAPIQALREADTSGTTSRGWGRRLVVGLLWVAPGAAALLYGLFATPANAGVIVGVGAAATFVGVTILSPLVAPAVASALGAPVARLGIPGGLGRRNAMRNPRRTATTAAALMIGLGLVSMVAILAASLKASFNATLEETIRADFTVSTTNFIPFSPEVADRIGGVDGVEVVSAFRTDAFRVNGATTFVTGVDPATVESVASLGQVEGDLSGLTVDQVLVHDDVAQENGWSIGDEVPAAFARIGDHPLEVVGIFEENALVGDYVISLSAYEDVFREQLDAFVLVRAAEGVGTGAVADGLRAEVAEFANIEVLDQAAFREKQAGFIDQLLGLVTALLAMAIVIALFGIVNTLGLSVYERTRELGLLRAVGMSRSQVRAMVRSESVIIALFGAVLGIAVGIFFGWALQQALEPEGVTRLAIPVGSLAVYLVFAALAGVLAAIAPARRAANLDVLQAVSYE